MQNRLFDIDFDEACGTVASIVLRQDEHCMNWCTEGGKWGRVICDDVSERHSPIRFDVSQMELLSFEKSADGACSVYSNGRLMVKVDRFFTSEGNFAERYTIKNCSTSPVYINCEKFGIELPFNEKYTYADDCLIHRCNTHIWCGHSTTWINALKMGKSENNLGLVLTKGAVDSYSIKDIIDIGYPHNGQYRGVFVLGPEAVGLPQGSEYVIEWEIFPHRGKEDFAAQIITRPQVIDIKAAHYTVFGGEAVEFEAKVGAASRVSVECNGQSIPFERKGDTVFVSYVPGVWGDYRIKVVCDDIYTFAEFAVRPAFEELLKKRIDFIVRHQQCTDESSPLWGAYLIYDNELESTWFNDYIPDHNACRERLGMPLLLCKYLQSHDDEEVRHSLDLYMDFVHREFYDETTGEVYNTIGKNRDMIRLYNAPWLMTLFAEMYKLTGDETYIKKIEKMADNYYSMGGSRFYPNGLDMLKILTCAENAGLPDVYRKLRSYFEKHVSNIIANGLSYPKHEVNYEQTIVTPAVTFISQMGLVSDDKQYYAKCAEAHAETLDLFSGTQPSFHLNEIAIRFWDDFWFGKSEMLGDTFPHYWSCLSGRAFLCYAELTSQRRYISKAEECFRNCMCLFDGEGRGSCAYVYPRHIEQKRGKFYDAWANDQDFALYFAMDVLKDLPR